MENSESGYLKRTGNYNCRKEYSFSEAIQGGGSANHKIYNAIRQVIGLTSIPLDTI